MLTPMEWHKLDRDRTVATINSVKTPGDHVLFSPATSEVKCARLPFYKNLMLYRLTNYASLPSFSFDYLGDGKTFFQLDGSPAPVYHANQSGNLALNADTVLDYIAFFFANVSGPDGDIEIIEDLAQHPALGTLGDTHINDLLARHQAAEITPSPDGGLVVKTSLFYLGALVRATIAVDPAGQIDVTDSHILLSPGGAFSERGINA